jgi:hypothetical protein
MPTSGQNKGIDKVINSDDTIVSYNEKEIVHCKLSLQTKKYFSSILYHFIQEPAENLENRPSIESTFGASYKPLGNRR